MIRRNLLICAGILSTGSSFAGCPALIQPEFTAGVVQRLSTGEVVMFPADAAAGQAGGAVQVLATRAEIWDVLTDPESAPSYMPTLRSAELLETRGNIQIVAQEVKIGILPAVRYQYRAESTPMKTINFEQTEGDLRDFNGGWLLVDGAKFGQPESVFVFYQVYLDPGLLVPQSVVQRSLRKDLPVVLRNVRQRIYDLRAENAPEVAVR